MNRDAKNISSSLRPQIEMLKGHIRASRGRWFSPDGNHITRTALKEMRTAGHVIEYNRQRDSYRLAS